MQHFVRMGMKLCIVEDDLVEYCSEYYGPVEEYVIKDGVIYGRIVEDLPDTRKLTFDQRQNTLTRGPREPDTITREQYYRRENGQ